MEQSWETLQHTMGDRTVANSRANTGITENGTPDAVQFPAERLKPRHRQARCHETIPI